MPSALPRQDDREVLMANTLTWLHMSDLHMRRDALDDIRVVLDALWDDLPQQIEQIGGPLDFIAFTGDVAFRGKEEEYKLAEEHFFRPLLEVTKTSRDKDPKDKLFLVPGNHDVDWDVVKLINPAVSQSLTDRSKVTALLADNAQRSLVFRPMAAYSAFVERLFGGTEGRPMLQDPLYGYAEDLRRGTASVALVGLSSAWLSGFTRDSRSEVIDKGQLVVGDKQLGDALMPTKGASLRIALMHHPPGWLREFDELDVGRWLRGWCQFVLQGHIHVPSFAIQDVFGSKIITIPAGTVYKGREWLNGYNLVQLDLDQGAGRVTLRRYAEEVRKWVKDVQSTTDSPSGELGFDLLGATARPAPPSPPVSLADQVLSEIEPRWLSLGRQREVQLVQEFIEGQEDTLWILGNEGCGLTEFLQIVRLLLRYENADTVYFDGEGVSFGTAIDQHYFLEKLERWAEAVPPNSDHVDVDADARLNQVLQAIEKRRTESSRRPAFIFANYQLYIPPIREWVQRTLWNRLAETLAQPRPLAVFACEGESSACQPASEKRLIHLDEFAVGDIQRFLRTTLSLVPFAVRSLTQEICGQGTGRATRTPPKRVYARLAAEMVRREQNSRTSVGREAQ